MKKYVITDGNWYMINPHLIPEMPTEATDFFTKDENLAFEFSSEPKANIFFSVSLPLMTPLLEAINTEMDNFFVLEIEEDEKGENGNG